MNLKCIVKAFGFFRNEIPNSLVRCNLQTFFRDITGSNYLFDFKRNKVCVITAVLSWRESSVFQEAEIDSKSKL